MFRLGLLAAFISGSAAAQCGACQLEQIVFLRDGARDVPLNAVIRVQNVAPVAGEYLLRKKSDSTELSVQLSSGPGSRLWALTPDAPLEPSTDYLLIIAGRNISFRTGATEDHVAPQAPVLNRVTYLKAQGSLCGSPESWTMDVSGGSDETTPRDELLLFVQTEGSNEAADARQVTTVSNLVLRRFCDDFIPPEGDSFPLAVQFMDLAGNMSERSAEKRAPACSVSLGGAMCMLTLALLRSRRSPASEREKRARRAA